MQPRTPLLCVLLSQVLMLTSAEGLDCTPGFQQKVFHIDQPAEFIKDQAILNLTFSDCKGNDKLRYEVSSPYFKVNNDGSLVALRNITAVGKTLFVHARTPHAEDMAELVIVGGKDIQGSLQDIFKFARTSPVPRQKRSIVVSPILIPENQRQPFPRDVGKYLCATQDLSISSRRNFGQLSRKAFEGGAFEGSGARSQVFSKFVPLHLVSIVK
uniref:Cadherin 13 n=1 Tax=Equus asinus TaxID=9793 RepID=A0A9L0JQY3_EQUAS